MQKGERVSSGRTLLIWGILNRALIHSFTYSRVEREKSQGLDPSKTGSTLKTAEDVKAHLENQLKQARLAAQQVSTLRTRSQFNKSDVDRLFYIPKNVPTFLSQKRLEQQRPNTPATTSTTTTTTTSAGTPSTPSTPASMGQRTGQFTPGTKMVLASKLGSPVSFQQDKNFHQSFASWVKQGQTNNGSGKPGQRRGGVRILSSSSEHANSSGVV